MIKSYNVETKRWVAILHLTFTINVLIELNNTLNIYSLINWLIYLLYALLLHRLIIHIEIFLFI